MVSLHVLVVSLALFVRILVGYQHHSGEDNYHGSKRAYGGDYEAQRHWMELTWHLPIGDWYWYDLQYWGLDYPPLTAYVSYVCGALSEWLVGPGTVALFKSRRYEGDPTHKAFMRATVWVLDALIYFPAVFFILKVLWQLKRQESSSTNEFLIAVLVALLQPSIILIDHGHFQYNTVALGLSLWSLFFIAHPSFFLSCIYGSVFFSLALNFKQMTLYYAPVIFAYLLGRCLAFNNGSKIPLWQQGLERFAALGGTVIITFVQLWWPFLLYGPRDNLSLVEDGSRNALRTMLQRGTHVLRRIFPLERGLFEGKVSNLWCALDTKPINIRDRIPADVQPLAALAATFLLMMPSCIALFLIGRASEQRKEAATRQHAADLKSLLWGCTSCAFAFFLASFQVHEKSILLALAPASLLVWEDVVFCDWMAVVATWTMWPLLVVDRLQLPYVCTLIIFATAITQLRTTPLLQTITMKPTDGDWVAWCWKILCQLSLAAMLVLHALEMVVPVPSHLPDLFPVLWSIGGCALCCLAWLRTVGSLLTEGRSALQKPKND
ncbi:Man9GlcNAc2 alpha-1,3-glucosyltransferase [Seminavis robusta]|uniref:Alpha-1,3-glucosyltransferase n=1 Tax=Seminavis robusta TaxID=568900 RepID=A0A9N8D4P9_9STRA|nr:Man9GlcNAc2 alpha-1,3-glucosyltransferase [Seminavis robusta]|eukprot:Sro4_g003020.1 Man9GlcNAc2 alpha-1,3-glucosyltransferase (550) ;mRNA; r:28182-29831